MNFKTDSIKIRINSWILGTFKIRKKRTLNLWITPSEVKNEWTYGHQIWYTWRTWGTLVQNWLWFQKVKVQVTCSKVFQCLPMPIASLHYIDLTLSSASIILLVTLILRLWRYLLTYLLTYLLNIHHHHHHHHHHHTGKD